MNDIVIALNETAFAESQNVAERFNKHHKNILSAIDRIIIDLTAAGTAVKDYFVKGSFYNSRNREYRNYLMTREGFALVAMTLEGQEAMIFKVQFIEAFKILERTLKEQYATKRFSIETRKTLTDKIKDSGENERMKGHAYSTYTKLAYKIIGIKYKKPTVGRFRDTLETEEVERLEKVEGMMKALVDAGQQYQEVKETINTIFGNQKRMEG